MLCLYTETRLLRGHQHLPPLPALQLDGAHPPCSLSSHPRETPSRAWPSEDPTQPHPTLLFVGHFVGLLIHPPHCGRASQPLSAPPGSRPRELRARLSGWGLGSELWELGQGLLGQRQSGCRLTGVTPPLLPALGSSVLAMDEPAFKGHACQQGGSLAPRQP